MQSIKKQGLMSIFILGLVLFSSRITASAQKTKTLFTPQNMSAVAVGASAFSCGALVCSYLVYKHEYKHAKDKKSRLGSRTSLRNKIDRTPLLILGWAVSSVGVFCGLRAWHCYQMYR